MPPVSAGYILGHRDPNRFDPATANALLDRFGYRHGADGYRSKPDGSTLAIPVLAGTSSESRGDGIHENGCSLARPSVPDSRT
ncbi:MAG: hypothetical protein IPF73_10715 [Betaproteobacteria bacterium]|nr:hypothetical protein [Betaproteobacteria bacterium]